jgi:tRNA pseudouridine55 synthase
MIIVVGQYCKRADEFSKLDKTYEATIRLGQTSSTGDPEGEITDGSDKKPTQQQIEQVLVKFRGQINQTPPIYSAIKINGQRAYKLARKGEKIEMPSRMVTIHSLELVDFNYPELKIRTHVGSGTYIRTLAEDIGKVLETGAYTSDLRRTAVGEYSIKNAQLIDEPINLISEVVANS